MQTVTIEIATEEELTATIRAFEIGFRMAQGVTYTPSKVACEFAMSNSGAWRLLQRISASRRVPVVEIDGIYRILDDSLDAKDWPY